jgi:hypothetical protein
MAKDGLERADATVRSMRQGYHRCKPGLCADLKARPDMPMKQGCAVRGRHLDHSDEGLRSDNRTLRRRAWHDPFISRRQDP